MVTACVQKISRAKTGYMSYLRKQHSVPVHKPDGKLHCKPREADCLHCFLGVLLLQLLVIAI